MIARHKKHKLYYLLLSFFLILSAFFILQLSFYKQLQFSVVVLTGMLYVAVGIIHHLVDHNISAKIVLEYVLIGSLGITIMLFFLRGVGL